MKRLAAIFVVAAAFSGVAPMAATAGTLGGGGECAGGIWPLTILLVPYC
jgi:hypothetical protein